VIHLASTPKGALRVGLSMEKDLDTITYLRSRLRGVKIIRDQERNRALAAAVLSALSKDLPPPLPPLDILLTPFQWQVLQAARCIPFGETRTYGQLAHQVQRPGAARAVGRVMHRNPLPLIFP
jgi:O6-methylguanine-DNA--protein-cysteine methyltransferase